MVLKTIKYCDFCKKEISHVARQYMITVHNISFHSSKQYDTCRDCHDKIDNLLVNMNRCILN